MHPRIIALSMMVIAGLACSADTLGTAMDSNAEQGSLGDEPGSSEAAESGESGSAGVDESEGQDTTTTTTTTTSATSTDEGCTLGSEGCPCTGGGGCDPGLECDAGTCVPAPATTGDPTTTDSTTTDSTTTDSTTTDSTTDSTTTDSGGDPFMCTLSNNCGDYDLASCTCQDCNTTGYCSQYEDCVCPDCTNENVCMGNACVNDGACEPYFEGCSCSDCAAHPLCG